MKLSVYIPVLFLSLIMASGAEARGCGRFGGGLGFGYGYGRPIYRPVVVRPIYRPVPVYGYYGRGAIDPYYGYDSRRARRARRSQRILRGAVLGGLIGGLLR